MNADTPPTPEKNYIEVVLTGGPGGGKTSAIPHLMRYYSERGIRVLCVPEMATLLFNSGISDLNTIRNEDPRAYASIQAQLLLMYQSMRTHYQALAEALAPTKVLILYDRGPCDSLAYMDRGMFFAILSENSFTLHDVRDSYDLVVHMVTAADGAREHYTMDNNAARWESPDEAVIADRNTQRAWLGHPHLRVIDNSTDFEGKLSRLVTHVNSVIDGPVHVEYERRYLLNRPPYLDTPELMAAQQISIEQTYLLTEDADTEVRVRKWAQGAGISYFWTRKRKLESGGREEREALIRPTEYRHLLSQADPDRHQIHKTRYCFVHDSQHCELDRIERDGKDPLWILEVELLDEKAPFVPPDWLDIDKEITDDPAYSNSTLAAD